MIVEPSSPAGGYRQHRFAVPPGATRLLLIRHGESAAADPSSPFPLVDGHGDPPLHAEGLRQAELLVRRLEEEPIAAAYVTTLRRTRQTIAPYLARRGLEARVEADLREVHLGEWEGGEYRVRAANGDPVFARMIAEQRWDVIPGAETFEAFDARLRAALGRLVAAHPDETVAAVTHGGVIGRLVANAAGAANRFAFIGADNASITELVVSGDRQIVRGFNDVGHLRI